MKSKLKSTELRLTKLIMPMGVVQSVDCWGSIRSSFSVYKYRLTVVTVVVYFVHVLSFLKDVISLNPTSPWGVKAPH